MAAGVAGATERVLPQPLPRPAAPPPGHRAGPRRRRTAGRRTLPARRPQPRRAGRSGCCRCCCRARRSRRCQRWPAPAPSCPMARSAKASCSANCKACRPLPTSCCAAQAEPPLPPQTHTLDFAAGRRSLALQWPLRRPARQPGCCAGATAPPAPATTWPPGCSTWRCAPHRPRAWRRARAGCRRTASSASSPATTPLHFCATCWRCTAGACASRCTSIRAPPGTSCARGASAARTAWQSTADLRRRRRSGLPAGAARHRRSRWTRDFEALAHAVFGPLQARAAGRARMSHDTPAFDVFGCPLHGTRLIEASAGTGKTWTLCGLYLRLLLERALPVAEILVVTFTNAATAELRERIRARIAETLARLRGSGPAPTDPFVDTLLQQLRERTRSAQRRHDRAPGPGAAELRRGLDPDDPRLLPARAGRSAVQHRHADAAGAAGRRQRTAHAGGARLLAPPHRRRTRCRRRWPATCWTARTRRERLGDAAAAAPGQAAVALAAGPSRRPSSCPTRARAMPHSLRHARCGRRSAKPSSPSCTRRSRG